MAVETRQRLVDGLLQHCTAANALVDDAGRNLTGAESGNVDLRADRLVGRVEARLELIERNLDGQLDPGRVEGLDGTLHYVALQDRGGRKDIARTREPSRGVGPCYRLGGCAPNDGSKEASCRSGARDPESLCRARQNDRASPQTVLSTTRCTLESMSELGVGIHLDGFGTAGRHTRD